MKQLAVTAFAVLLLSGCYYDNRQELYQYYDSQCNTTDVSYSLDIVPIMTANCVSCHQAPAPSGNVLLTTYEEVKISAENGSLYGSVTGIGYPIMPQSGKMPDCNINKIDAWIQAGMPNN
jgi:hypothetical protein